MTSEKRNRQKEARTAQQQARAKAQARKETLKRIWTALGVGAAVAIVLLITATVGGENSDLSTEYQAYRDQPTACGAALPAEPVPQSFSEPEDQNLDPGTPVTAVLTTSCGDITITLDPSGAPETVNSFVFLARKGFYNGTVFHRVVPGFMIQGGDPLATGFGDPGYSLSDEFPEAGFEYQRGVVAMANAGRGTTGSQFFIVNGPDASGLPNSFTVIGTVSAGLDALDAISALPTETPPGRSERSRPLETVYIETISIAVG